MNVNPHTREQEQPRWTFRFERARVLRITGIGRPSCTSSQVYNSVQEHVEASAPENIPIKVVILLAGGGRNVPNDQDFAFLAGCCQSLGEHFKSLQLGSFDDNTAHGMLHHLCRASLQVKSLKFHRFSGATLTRTIPLLRDVLHNCCQSLSISQRRLLLSSADCHILGQILANKQLALPNLRGWASCVDWREWHDAFTILAGCFVGSLRRNGTENDDSEFRRIASAFYERKGYREFINYVEPLRQAGFASLLVKFQEHAVNGSSGNGSSSNGEASRSLEEWVEEVFSHELINDRVDLLFHILSSNPVACVEAASLRQ